MNPEMDPIAARHMRLAAASVFAGMDNFLSGRNEDFVDGVLGECDRDDLYGVIAALSAMVANTVPEGVLRQLIARAAAAEAAADADEVES